MTDCTADGAPQVWLLYRPEPFHPDGPEEREINLWVRRCDVFTSAHEATLFLSRLLGCEVGFRKYHPIFPELWIWERRVGSRKDRWLLCPAPVNPPGVSA